jgi:phosphorylcholine metabolism protein LicD
MKKTLIFGASQGGINFINNDKQQRKYLAFIDNDLSKNKQILNGLEIISPDDIKNFDYDEIVIASYWVTSIKSQLTTSYKIPQKQIYIPPKEMLMDIPQPFCDENAKDFAKLILSTILQKAIEQDIPLYANNGTLLGIIRDDDILSWDTDIDIAILEKEATKYDIELFISNSLKSISDTKFKLTKIINKNNQILSYKIDFYKKNVVPFPISIEYMGIDEEFVIELVSLGQFKVPKKFVLTLDTTRFNNTTIYIPNNVEKYLQYIYGNWQIPKKNISFNDYNNYNKIDTDTFLKTKIQQIVIFDDMRQ